MALEEKKKTDNNTRTVSLVHGVHGESETVLVQGDGSQVGFAYVQAHVGGSVNLSHGTFCVCVT